MCGAGAVLLSGGCLCVCFERDAEGQVAPGDESGPRSPVRSTIDHIGGDRQTLVRAKHVERDPMEAERARLLSQHMEWFLVLTYLVLPSVSRTQFSG